ncbi:MAG: hypothetical protein NDI75_07560 [Candidatus Didemnitutus sp.]|nr:hypothetical protein [Candidatus Didemnitutus sp.]
MSVAAKVSLLSAYVLRPGHWDATAEQWSRMLPHDWPGDAAKNLADLVASGAAEVWKLYREGEDTGDAHGLLVASVDRNFSPPEFVVQAAYSLAPGNADLTAQCLPAIEARARSLGCGTVRFHTMRPGLVAKSLRAGFHVSEVVMRKPLR